MHNPDFMLQLLVNLALHYPQAGRTPAQLQILAEDWAEDLAEFSPGTVEKAVKRYRRESPYFPTVADIWARCDELRRGETALADALALPGRTLTREEQRMLNGEWCAKILANLRCKMDARKQGRPDTPLDEQLANLWALGVEQ
ncbi:hypothetical protein Bwad002_17660 [Bilophila wadsworthia]